MVTSSFNGGAMYSEQTPGLQGQGVSLNQSVTFENVFNGRSLMDVVGNGIHPFEDGTKHFGPKDYGVICIENIPYNVTKAEIDHFLGKNAGLIPAHVAGCPIHIIMERPTSKTMDCYVEVFSDDAALAAYQRHENFVGLGRHPRLGQRHVEVVVADQDELMRALFPRARGLVWENGIPRKVENNDPYSSGYQGFFTTEEMIGMARHAETPQRSPFSVKCLQRTFECMISTLYKFPWHAQHMYTLNDRDLLFKTYITQLEVLVEKVAEARTVGLDMRLLMDFLFAGVNCPGFGERMKHSIAITAKHVGAGLMVGQLNYIWPFDVLSKPRFAPDGAEWDKDVIMFFVYIIELGVSVQCGDFLHSEFIRALPPSPLPYPLDEKLATNTRFVFKEEVYNRSYDEIIQLEEELMRALIHTGFVVWSNSIRLALQDGEMSGGMAKDIEIFEQLKVWDLTKTEWDQEASKVVEAAAATDKLTQLSSPAQSPKGTITTGHGTYDVETESLQVESLSLPNATSQPEYKIKRIDPTVDSFKPQARRMSEPQLSESDDPFSTPVKDKKTFDHPFYTPGPNFRRNSSAIEIRRPDDLAFDMGVIGAHLSSPIKMRAARGGFSIDHTIEEGNEDEGGDGAGEVEEDIVMMTGKRLAEKRRKSYAGH